MSSIDDRNFKLAVLAGAAALVAVLVALRFCGEVALPPKPPPPRTDIAAEDLLANTNASPRAWRGFVEGDAAAAGLPIPEPGSLARRFSYRMDDTRRPLEPGAAPIDTAGLRLSAQVSRGDGGDDILVLSIENRSDSDVAYRVITRPNVGTQVCHGRSILAYNAMVVAKGWTEKRSECAFRKGMYLHVDRVEAIDVPPLSALYVSRVAPAAVGIEQRLALGHRPKLPRSLAVCSMVPARTVLAALETGALGWRDLVDFYARHRCDTYSFLESYRAFNKDNERSLPAVR